ncbi:hypothetical protein JCM10450v2_008159 [Rhodotorula kratochvilovae]
MSAILSPPTFAHLELSPDLKELLLKAIAYDREDRDGAAELEKVYSNNTSFFKYLGTRRGVEARNAIKEKMATMHQEIVDLEATERKTRHSATTTADAGKRARLLANAEAIKETITYLLALRERSCFRLHVPGYGPNGALAAVSEDGRDERALGHGRASGRGRAARDGEGGWRRRWVYEGGRY